MTTADLVCHGVPSQRMLTENIHNYTYDTDGSKIKVSFRRKTGRKFYNDSYMFGFLQCLTFRVSCYACRYATSARCSDITFADFLGGGDDAGFDKGSGVSLCLVNSDKGLSLINQIAPYVKIVVRDVIEAIIGNGQLQRPSCKNNSHKKFRILYPSKGLDVAIHDCLKKEKFRLSVIEPVKHI